MPTMEEEDISAALRHVGLGQTEQDTVLGVVQPRDQFAKHNTAMDVASLRSSRLDVKMEHLPLEDPSEANDDYG